MSSGLCPYCGAQITTPKQYGIVPCPQCEHVLGIGDLVKDDGGFLTDTDGKQTKEDE